MGCTNEPNDRDVQMLQKSANGMNCNPDPRILEELRLDIQIEKEMERCLEERREYVRVSMNEILNERIKQENRPPSPLEKLDLESWQTEKEQKAMVKAGKEIGISPVEIVSTPDIVGTKEVEKIEEKIKETVNVLHNSKIHPDFRAEYRVNKIMFIDQEKAGLNIKPTTIGNVFIPEKFETNIELLRTIHIFRKADGQFPKGKELLRVLAHEIYHINHPSIEERLASLQNEWEKACKAQIENLGPVSYYAAMYEVRGYSKEDVQFDEEFQAEHYSHWVVDSSKLCTEMKSFFDAHFT